MKILSIYLGHNSSVVYFNKNELIYALSEERFLRKKIPLNFPIRL